MLSRALETHKNKRTLVDHLASKNKKQKTSASRSTIRLPDTLKEETTTQDGCSPSEQIFTEESIRVGLSKWLRQDFELKFPSDKLRLGYFNRLRDLIYRTGFDPHRKPLINPVELNWPLQSLLLEGQPGRKSSSYLSNEKIEEFNKEPSNSNHHYNNQLSSSVKILEVEPLYPPQQQSQISIGELHFEHFDEATPNNKTIESPPSDVFVSFTGF